MFFQALSEKKSRACRNHLAEWFTAAAVLMSRTAKGSSR